MGSVADRIRLADQENKAIDERVSNAIANSKEAGIPASYIRLMDEVLRPYCKFLAKCRRDEVDIEEVYLSWLHISQNMMAELMLVTSDDHNARTKQALHMANVFLQSLPGVMQWAKEKTLLSGTVKRMH